MSMQPSFAYVYDGGLAQPSWAKFVSRVESEVGRLGIQGPILRDGFHELTSQLKEVFAQGVKNLIFVGGDAWFLRWIPWIVEQTGMSVGYLPIEPSPLARAFGIPAGAAGVPVLAARVLRSLDIAFANERAFLLEAVALKTIARLELEGSYAVRARLPSPLSIQNLALDLKAGRALSVPDDGQLEAVIQTANEEARWFGLWKKEAVEETRILFERATVRTDDAQPVQFSVDGQPLKAKEIVFHLKKQAMACIVGPDRLF